MAKRNRNYWLERIWRGMLDGNPVMPDNAGGEDKDFYLEQISATLEQYGGMMFAPTVGASEIDSGLASDGFVLTADGAGNSAFEDVMPVNTVAASGAAQTLSDQYAVHVVTLDDNCTFTFPTPVTNYFIFELVLIQDVGGGNTVTWPGTVEWANGAAPNLTTTGNNKSILSFSTYDGGTSWFGSLSGDSVA